MDAIFRLFLNAVAGLIAGVFAMFLTLCAGDPFRFETPPITEELALRTLTQELAEAQWQGFSSVERFQRTLRRESSHREPFALAAGQCAAVVVATHGEMVPAYLHVVPRGVAGDVPLPTEALSSQHGGEHVALQTQLCTHEALELDVAVGLSDLEWKREGETTLHVAIARAPREALIGELGRGEVRPSYLWAAPAPPAADVEAEPTEADASASDAPSEPSVP